VDRGDDVTRSCSNPQLAPDRLRPRRGDLATMTDPESLSGGPSLASQESVLEVARQIVGTRAILRHWYVRRDTYVVASVAATDRFVVKLEVPGARPNRRFDAMAAVSRRVSSETTVPTFDVVAVDISRRGWPRNLLVVTELAGETWAHMYPGLDEARRATAQRQLGRAAAQLHAITFDAFGEVGADGRVAQPRGPVAALAARADRRLRTSRFRDYFRQVMDAHVALLAAAPGPRLCHEDLNPHNVLFKLQNGEPTLTGVLDFESAWAGLHESDLARLELWRWTHDGYAEAGCISDTYRWRRPILQLLWCLEYAEYDASVQHQLDTRAVCDELGLDPIQLGPGSP
jgi:phosphotransferase family enzyme